MNASRIVRLRVTLRSTTDAGECMPLLGEMVLRAEHLLARGEDPGMPRRLLDDAVTYLRAALAVLPASSENGLLTRYLLARACLLRGDGSSPVPDIDDAIENLRRLRSACEHGIPDQVEIASRLGSALFSRAFGASGRIADLDEAAALLESMRLQVRSLPDGEVLGRAGDAMLALVYATRFGLFGGTGADRDTAIGLAEAALEAPQPEGPGEAHAHGCYVLAWMALTRHLTEAQRSSVFLRADLEAARADRQAAQALFGRLGDFRIDRADATTAIGYLRQIRTPPADADLRAMLPMLWGLALMAALRTGEDAAAEYEADADRVAEELSLLVDGTVPGTLEHGEAQGVRGAILALLAAARVDGGTADKAANPAEAEALAALEALPAENLARTPLLGMLGYLLRRQVTRAPEADDLGARLDEIAAAMDRLPDDDPAAAEMMIGLGTTLMGMIVTHRSALSEDRLIPQLERFGSRLAPHAPLRPFARFMECAARGLFGVIHHRVADVDQAITEMNACVRSADAAHATRSLMLLGLAATYLERHAMSGEIRYLEQAERTAEEAVASADATGGSSGPSPELSGALLLLQGHVQLVRCSYDPDPARIEAAFATLKRADSLTAEDSVLRTSIAFDLHSVRALRDFQSGEPGQEDDAAFKMLSHFRQLRETAKRTDPDSPDYPFLVGQAANGLIAHGAITSQAPVIDEALVLLADVCAMPGLAVRERTRLLLMHGYGLLTRHSVTRDPRDLGNAISRLEAARQSVEQEVGSPQAAEVLLELAGAYRTRAGQSGGEQRHRDADRAAALGLAGLREHVGDVFLQDSEENALLRAARGAGEAIGMARWFLANAREPDAVSALELGRGMVLQAATSGGRVEEILRDAGHAALADGWHDQSVRPAERDTEAFADLRYRVMMAIERSPAEARLLAPPAVGDIAAALTRSGTDALVYLIPADETGGGTAVFVYPDGTIATRLLPALRTGEDSPVRAFASARRATEIDADNGDADRERWKDALDALCTWAWSAAVGPLLDMVRRARATSWPRVVLVPCGELGLVPWHAAREPGSGRYAVQDAVFLYASSARQFTDTDRLRPRPWADSPALICDTASSLYLTAVTIAYLHGAHYGTGAVYGRARRRLAASVPGTQAATREDVLGAFPRAGSPGASMLHFGCHGRVRIPVLDSGLSLGTDSAGRDVKVEIRDILRQVRAGSADGPPGAGAGGLVVLAACVTDVTERDFDEALSVATALLSAGAAGVIATRWSVPEASTAVFMAAFHQFLNDGQHPDPALALRRAQLWMLDPDREVPDRWPKALRDEAAATGPEQDWLAAPEAWAGFTYQGTLTAPSRTTEQ